ncbi:hypothetical protein Tco_0311823 [Tanacetum coccineum]
MLGIPKLSFHLTSLLASYELLKRHEMKDDLVGGEVDCMMVVKEIENGLLEEVEVGLFEKKEMILELMKDVIEWQSMVWIEEDAKDGLAKHGSASLRL